MAGKIISTANGSARVATAQGIIEVAMDGSGNVGDRVTVRDGRAVRVQETVDVPVFFRLKESPARHGFMTDPMASGTDQDTTSTYSVDLSESSAHLQYHCRRQQGEFTAYATADTAEYAFRIFGSAS